MCISVFLLIFFFVIPRDIHIGYGFLIMRLGNGFFMAVFMSGLFFWDDGCSM